MNAKASVVAIFFALALAGASASQAQSIVSEDFTGTGTNSKWYSFAGACLTAGTSTSTTQPDVVPACSALLPTYYYNNSNTAVSPDHDPLLVGGNNGYLGSSSAPTTLPTWPATPPAVTPDPPGFGALRFTNGRPYGHNQAGAIVGPETAFPTGAGVQITFKTLTYRGNSYDNGVTGGAHATDGADGISFFLMDGTVTPTAVGAFGGSLGYSCSNGNGNGDGLVGAYLGLGIDEFGNFLNGATNSLGVASPQGMGDNTATGGGRYANRIGLRGAGSISWAYLTSLYGTNPNDSTQPYYPSYLNNPVCASGTTLNSSNKCASCSSGSTYVPGADQCDTCASGSYVSSNRMCASCTVGTYNSSNQTCTVVTNGSCPSGSTLVGSNCDSCPAGYNFDLGTTKCYSASTCASGYTFNGSNALAQQCYKCASNYTYQSVTACTKLGSPNKTPSLQYPANVTPTKGPIPTNTTTPNATEVAATQTTVKYAGPTYPSWYAVRATCKTGLLQNWPTATSTGGASTSTAIMDYPAIPNGWTVLPTSVGPIANEGATTRTDAVPILYNLKITQDGLLSLSYSYNGGATTPVLTSQSITASNGTLPTSFRFGFAGSTGGGTNIHEILCFKATPAQTSNSSGSVNVYQNPTLKNGTTQLFLAYYFPSDWTGQLTAQSIGFDTTTNSIVVNTLPNWDARCVLTGVNAITGKCSTGVASQTAESPDSRVMLTWNGTTGVPFRYNSLSTAQQAAMTTGTALSSPSDRVNYLRGDRTNEVNSAGVGEFRARDSVLGDIINSSPQWLGPPQEPYEVLNSWVDDLYPSATPPENATTRSYAAYQATEASRTNIVYVGANDGFLHGFRAGALDASGNLVTTTPNDGNEVLAYMPGTVLNNIHPVDSSGNVIGPLDYSNTQYGHNYFVDATPAVGDIFFNGKWHTWLVGGLGAGGAAIYVLNVTDPSQFSESTPAYNPLTDQGVVVGEWTPATLKCVGNTTCGANLGNTYGTPEIRRFHNGQWGAIIGNGFGSTNGTAGIYIMLFNDDGSQSIYYLGTNTQTANGIASPASLDLDLDHITDYIYAGDLQGNVWRFDVTSQNPALWAVSASSPLFTTGSGQPITTRPTVGTLKTISTSTTLAGTTLSTAPERVIIDFGTGQQIGQTLNNATQYATGQQYLYGIWDWDMGTATVAGSGWNWLSRNGQQALSLTAVGPETISTSNMVEQTVTTEVAAAGTTPGYRKVSHNPICWMGDSGCTTSGFLGWYMPLPDSGEQVIYDPVLSPDGEFTVNTFVPSPSSILSCTVTPASGWSMGIQADTGAGSPTPFFAINGSLSADGIQLNGTGIPSFLSSGQAADNNSEYLITQTNSGPAPPAKVNRHVIVSGQRLNWIQRR